MIRDANEAFCRFCRGNKFSVAAQDAGKSKERADFMQVLSHRGYWKTAEEKNTEIAFTRSFTLGFGTETDVRDWNGQLVISHDPPTGQPMLLETFLTLYKKHGDGLPLALNVKADGLQKSLLSALEANNVRNYFVFDMSVPDTLLYLNLGMNVFTRHSEYEPNPAFYEIAKGVWMDCFEGDWMTDNDILSHLKANKQVCLVSPDLHKREHFSFWNAILAWKLHRENHLLLCTDNPEQAREFFHEEY